MKAIIKREIKNYLKNPIFWIGLVIVIAGVYQCLAPYMKIHYFKSDEEIQKIKVSVLSDADIADGYLPASPEEQVELAAGRIKKSLTDDLKMSESEADEIIRGIRGMSAAEAAEYLRKYHFYGAEYVFEDYRYRQGTMEEVNGYISEKLKNHTFSYYFSRKFADFGGLYMAFFSVILFAFLFIQDTRKNTYELLHTKPVRAWQYVLGKVGGGFLTGLLVLAVLNVVFMTLCFLCAKDSGFPVNPADFLFSTCVYILPNMLMIICVYTITALLFKNPLPAVPLLFLYIVYSNMGSTGPDGMYGYYGRPLAIMVRFPGTFFDTSPPPMVWLNQLFLVFASALLMTLAVYIWKRRRVY